MIQNTFQRFISLLLSLTMLMSLASTAFAVDTGADTPADFTGADIESVVSVNATLSEEEVAKNLFESLSEEAKQIFLAQIATDPELTEYHRENVDPSFDPQTIPVAYANSEVDRVRSGLINLGFSTSVTYCFVNVASEISAQVGAYATASASQIYEILVGLGLASAMVSWWDEIDTRFGEIVNEFKEAFAEKRSAVSNALWDTRDDAASIYYESPVTSVRYYDATSTTLPRVVIRHANGDEERFICDVSAENFRPRTNKFYVAALLRDSNRKMHLWVCPDTIDYATALAIRYINYEYVGIMTDSRNLASHFARQSPGVTLSLDKIKFHPNESHKDNPNYLPHYHPLNSSGRTDKQIHIWYYG